MPATALKIAVDRSNMIRNILEDPQGWKIIFKGGTAIPKSRLLKQKVALRKYHKAILSWLQGDDIHINPRLPLKWPLILRHWKRRGWLILMQPQAASLAAALM